MSFFLKNIKNKTILIWLRIFYVFGQKQRKGSLLEVLRNRKKNFFIKTPFVKNDYIFIKDVIDAFVKVKTVKKNSVVNVCSSKAISNLDFIRKFLEISKKKIIINYNRNDKNKKTLLGDNKKLKALGWKQKYSLDKAFREIIFD